MKAKQSEIDQRRMRVARAYCQGKGVMAIAADEGVNHSTISRDLAVIRQEWKEARHGLIDARVAEELAKIEHLEMVAWEAWHRSCEDAQTHKSRKLKGKTVMRTGINKDGKRVSEPFTLPDIDLAEMTRKGQSGNPAFLERVSWCINRRIILLGMDPSKQMVLPTPEVVDDGLSDAEREAALLRIIAEMGFRVVREDSWQEGDAAGIPLLGGPGAPDEGGGEGPGPVAGEAAAGEMDEGPPPLFPAGG